MKRFELEHHLAPDRADKQDFSRTYFDDMESAHSAYFLFYQQTCDAYRGDPEVQKMISGFVVEQIGRKKGVRGWMLNTCLELSRGEEDILAFNNTDTSKIAAAFELLLASMYCYNVAADGKVGYTTDGKKQIAFRARDVVVELANNLLKKTTLSDESKSALKGIFRIVNEKFYVGEAYNIIINLYKNIGKTSTQIKNQISTVTDFEKSYGIPQDIVERTLDKLPPERPMTDFIFERTYGINAAMFESMGDLAAVVTNLSKEKKDALKNFGKYYGMEMQIINDVQDFTLDLVESEGQFATREKLISDVFNDVKTGKISWPIKYTLELDSGIKGILDLLMGNKDASYEDLDNLRKRCAHNGAFKKSVLTAMGYVELAKDSLTIFEDSKPKRMLIDAAVSLAKLSKYVRVVKKAYDVSVIPSKVSVREEARRIREEFNRT